MTSTVTQTTTSFLTHMTIGQLSTGIGFAAIVALIALLLVRELTSLGQVHPARNAIRALDMATVPLLVVFAIVIVSRLADLLK